MSEIAQRVIDHPEWKNGAVVEAWTDEATGYSCMIRYGPLGSLNGYVAVPVEHPWRGRDHDDDAIQSVIDVHGGLTFSGAFEDHWYKYRLHANDPLLTAYWFGFDTAHYGDIVPAMAETMRDGTIRDATYVKAECTELARKLKAAGAAS